MADPKEKETPNIVVIARKQLMPNNRATTETSNSSYYATPYRLPDYRPGPGQPATPPAENPPAEGDIFVNVKLSDVKNLNQATEAAINIANSLTTWRQTLEALPADAEITVVARKIKASTALRVLKETEWVVTDQEFENTNNGVGAAIVVVGKYRRDYLNFKSFIASSQNSYFAPGYTNGEAMLFILMHEIAHLSDEGQTFRNTNISVYSKSNNNSNEGFNNSPQFVNVEKWANDFAAAMMQSAFPFGVGQFSSPRYGYNAVWPTMAGGPR